MLGNEHDIERPFAHDLVGDRDIVAPCVARLRLHTGMIALSLHRSKSPVEIGPARGLEGRGCLDRSLIPTGAWNARHYPGAAGNPLRAKRRRRDRLSRSRRRPVRRRLHPGFISHVELMTEMPTYQGRIVERVSSFARVIVLDQRGVGMSDRMSGTPGLETRVDDVRAVMDAAGSSRAAILSASIGVPTSLLFAATYPERTSALVLVRGFARFLWALDYPWGWTTRTAALGGGGVSSSSLRVSSRGRRGVGRDRELPVQRC